MAEINLDEIADEYKIHSWGELITAITKDNAEGMTEETYYIVNDIDIYNEYNGGYPPQYEEAKVNGSYIIEGMGHTIRNIPVPENKNYPNQSAYIWCYGTTLVINNVIFRNIYPKGTTGSNSTLFVNGNGSTSKKFTFNNCQFYGDLGKGNIVRSHIASATSYLQNLELNNCVIVSKYIEYTYGTTTVKRQLIPLRECSVNNSYIDIICYNTYYSDGIYVPTEYCKTTNTTMIIRDNNKNFGKIHIYGAGSEKPIANTCFYIYTDSETASLSINESNVSSKCIIVNANNNAGITKPEETITLFAYSNNPSEVITETWLTDNGFNAVTE